MPFEAVLVPVLPSSDLTRSLAYYRYLGFDVLEHERDYARLALQGGELHLYPDEGVDALANSAGCYLKVADPQTLHEKWCEDGVQCFEAPVASYFGRTAFAVVDPDGNTLRFGPLTVPAPDPLSAAQF